MTTVCRRYIKDIVGHSPTKEMIMDFASFEETSGFATVENEELVQITGGKNPEIGLVSGSSGTGVGATWHK
jgi:hypothetical protein